MASPKKRAKKSGSKKQVPATSLPVLDHSIGQDLERGSEAMDLNGLDGVMDILADISSFLQTTETGMEDLRDERVTARTQSPSTSRQGGCAYRGL